MPRNRKRSLWKNSKTTSRPNTTASARSNRTVRSTKSGGLQATDRSRTECCTAWQCSRQSSSCGGGDPSKTIANKHGTSMEPHKNNSKGRSKGKGSSQLSETTTISQDNVRKPRWRAHETHTQTETASFGRQGDSAIYVGAFSVVQAGPPKLSTVTMRTQLGRMHAVTIDLYSIPDYGQYFAASSLTTILTIESTFEALPDSCSTLSESMLWMFLAVQAGRSASTETDSRGLSWLIVVGFVSSGPPCKHPSTPTADLPAESLQHVLSWGTSKR